MIRRSSALLARLMLVLAVFGLSIPAPALMKCITGQCPLPCCTETGQPDAKCCKPKPEPEPAHSCCASKKKPEHQLTQGHGSCDACKCELKSSTPAVAKKLDSLALGDQQHPVMGQPKVSSILMPTPIAVERVIFATDSSPPLVRPHTPNLGRAPPVIG